MLQFFTMLWGDATGWIPAVTYPKSERESGKPFKDWRLSKFEWFKWPSQAAEMVTYCETNLSQDVYVPVGLCSARRLIKENVLPLRVIHCDADKVRPDLFAVKPSIIVQSSPNRFQLYWMLKKPASPKQAEQLSKMVAYSQRKQGSDTGWQCNKLMRVPGTTNTKPEYKMPVVTLDVPGQVYSFKELRKEFNLPRPRNSSSPATAELIPETLPTWANVLRKIPGNRADLLRLIQEPAYETTWNPKGSRYMVIYKLSCALFRLGFTREEVFIACSNSASNKYEQDGRDPTELWRDVLKAEAEVETNVVFVDEDADGTPIPAAMDLQSGVALITEEERELIYETFIERYIQWAITKTHADIRYHRANAITLISTVLSEYGYAIPGYGSMGLQMWFMVLGVTSRSFKTTAAKMMLRTLKQLDREREFPYLLADDPTPEAMNQTLGERGEISSLFHVDEAQGLITAVKGGRSYMAGFISLLTKLYDGDVPQRERITTENTGGGRTYLTVNLLGVPKAMTDALTRDDFASGFLARFIFVLGDPAPDDPEAMWLEQSDPTMERDMDPRMSELLGELNVAIKIWELRMHNNGDKSVPIPVDTDAWIRWNQLVLDLNELAKKSLDPEAVLPTAHRTAVSVHKLACLLAMVENDPTVAMKHMITAINYAQEWYDTMNLVSGMVHQNNWARQVQELITFIGPTRKTYMQVYRNKFSGLKAREFGELVESAVMTGQLKHIQEQRKNGSMVAYLEGVH